jgi:hypothetical protein
MTYEARWSSRFHWTLAVAVALLPILGVAAAGVLPTACGAYPLVGWTVVAACFGYLDHGQKELLAAIQARVPGGAWPAAGKCSAKYRHVTSLCKNSISCVLSADRYYRFVTPDRKTREIRLNRFDRL